MINRDVINYILVAFTTGTSAEHQTFSTEQTGCVSKVMSPATGVSLGINYIVSSFSLTSYQHHWAYIMFVTFHNRQYCTFNPSYFQTYTLLSWTCR